MRYLILFVLITALQSSVSAQKVLQIEKFGKAKTNKLYIGDQIFIQTKDNPDWFLAEIEDLLPDAQAIVFYDRIIQIQDITAMKFRKKSKVHDIGRVVQFSWVVPVAYQAIYDVVDPPFEEEEWKPTAIVSAGTFLLGSLMRLIPPKKHKFGEGTRRRLRILDLTFYPTN